MVRPSGKKSKKLTPGEQTILIDMCAKENRQFRRNTVKELQNINATLNKNIEALNKFSKTVQEVNEQEIKK